MNRLTYIFPVLFVIIGFLASMLTYYSQTISVIGYMTIGIGVLYLAMIILYDFVESFLKVFKAATSKKYAIILLYVILLIALGIIVLNKNYLIPLYTMI
ncbi:hypothetical protein, partial [Cysteiniphilum halobium]|uniref:hypothetical protein n=1 Tax=Cysteiniphilum halobium TaxID=2219059 RepID=UPI0013C322BF